MDQLPNASEDAQAYLNRLSIRELHEAYADAVLRFDAADWGQCWAEDGKWTIMGRTLEGRTEIVRLWEQAMGRYRAASFIAVPGPIEIEGDTAQGRCQTHELFHEKSGTRQLITGAYDDRLVRRNGRWLFASRAYRIVAEVTFPADQDPM